MVSLAGPLLESMPARAQSPARSIPDSLRLAPPLEEIAERGQRIVNRRRRGARLFLAASAVSFVIIGVVRTRQRMARRRQNR